MRDRPLILAGLVLFLVGATFPVWYNVASRTAAAAPALPRASRSVVAGAQPAQCVAPVEEMRASHMVLLQTWRNDVVRTGARTFVAPDGHPVAKSLTGTCLDCHGRKAEFCDRCHQYAGVAPACMDCHVDPNTGRSTR